MAVQQRKRHPLTRQTPFSTGWGVTGTTRGTARVVAEDLATLRALMRTHEQRLQGRDPIALGAALEAAVCADVTATPVLNAALRQAVKADILRSKRRAPQN
jgi:hypothetical protein